MIWKYCVNLRARYIQRENTIYSACFLVVFKKIMKNHVYNSTANIPGDMKLVTELPQPHWHMQMDNYDLCGLTTMTVSVGETGLYQTQSKIFSLGIKHGFISNMLGRSFQQDFSTKPAQPHHCFSRFPG